MKLRGFAQCIKDMNESKGFIWRDDGLIVKQEWKKVDGFTKREISQTEFTEWWPTFLETLAVRMDEAIREEAEKEAKRHAVEAEKVSRYSSDGVWRIGLREIPEAIEAAQAKGKTPLIIDNTPAQRVETFFLYSDFNPHIIECKKMVVDKAQGKSVDEILQERRDAFFSAACFKHGNLCLFRLANSAIDIKSTFNSDIFPAMSLLDATEVNQVRGLENAANFKSSPFQAMCPDEGTAWELDCMGVNGKFSVAALTHFQEEDYEEYLKDMFPLHLMQPIKPEIRE